MHTGNDVILHFPRIAKTNPLTDVPVYDQRTLRMVPQAIRLAFPLYPYANYQVGLAVLPCSGLIH